MKKNKIDNEFISVVIPAYNSEPTIRETIKSLENQTIGKKSFEVIVLDDGSTDNTGSIVKEFVKNNTIDLKYFYQKNSGVGVARNAGISYSKGRILAFTDADCICDKKWIETIYDKIVRDKMILIGGETYCNDILIYPWKNSPAGQTGITANMALDRSYIVGDVFSSDFKVMFGDDTNFVIKMKDKGINQEYIPEMRVLHPANILSFRRMYIRSKGRVNDVLLYKMHGKKVLSSFNIIFRPIIFGRLSIFFFMLLFSIFVITLAYIFTGFLGILVLFILFFLIFYFFLYKFLIVYNPTPNIPISPKDRIKTFFYFVTITPFSYFFRIKGNIKFKYLML